VVPEGEGGAQEIASVTLAVSIQHSAFSGPEVSFRPAHLFRRITSRVRIGMQTTTPWLHGEH
jgi:hypothetical protein